MKKITKEFCLRGMMFAWSGPVILAIVWICLEKAHVVETVTVNEVVVGILSATVMAFIATGISIVYEIENLPKAIAGLLQGVVLYIDYLGLYLLNGWLPSTQVLLFTVVFIAGFTLIWLCIYISIRIKVNKMNQIVRNDE